MHGEEGYSWRVYKTTMSPRCKRPLALTSVDLGALFCGMSPLPEHWLSLLLATVNSLETLHIQVGHMHL